MLTKLLRRLRARKRIDQDLADELAAHLALKQQRLEAEGRSPEQAAREARMALGNPAVWREESRAEWTWVSLESIWQDFTFGVRLLAKSKAFTAVALLTLMLGIGANTAVFTLMNALLWRGLPVKDPGQLVRIRVTNLPPSERAWMNGRQVAAVERRQISYALYEALGKDSELFDGVCGMAGGGGTVVADVNGTPYQFRSSYVTGTYFPVLGLEPLAGRMLSPADDTPSRSGAIVISDAVWARVFQREPRAIGSTITLEQIPFTIAGVAPARFAGLQTGVQNDIWIPLSAMERMYPQFQWRNQPGMWMLQTVSRLKSGLTIEQAQKRLNAKSVSFLQQAKETGLSAADEKNFFTMKLDAVSAKSGFSWLVETYRPVLWTLMTAVGIVLLIAATNLTNLLLARATARRHEIAIRLALGASAGRVRRQLLIESAILAIAGTGLGVLFARFLMDLLLNGPTQIALDTSIDWRIAAFIGALLAAIVIVAGWAPAWTAPNPRSNPRTVLRSGLIVLQTALSVVLLGGAILVTSSLQSLLKENTGFDVRQTVFLSPDLFNAGISRERLPRAYENLLDAVRSQPGVQAAAWTMNIPLSGSLQSFTIEIPGQANLNPKERMVFAHQVTDGYFAATGVPLVAGRDFPSRPSPTTKYAIVSNNLARRYFGSAESALGRRIKAENRDLEIIGVAADAKYHHVRETSPPTLYTSYWDRQSFTFLSLVVRFAGAQEPVIQAVEALFQREAGRMPFTQTRTLTENLTALVSTERLLARLLTAFAAFAILICATGIAGLLSYAVQLRRREIGIRIALGARPGQIQRQFQRYAAILAMGGLALGALLSFWLRRGLDAYLYGIQAGNPYIWMVVTAALLAAAVLSATIPARRAARLDPMQVLRTE